MSRLVVVTGASGFIGRALIDEFARRDIQTLAVSRRPCAVPSGADVSVVADYPDTPVPAGATLIHLAERADIGEAERLGEQHLQETRQRIMALLVAARGRIVYASSGRVYGSETIRPHPPADPTRADCFYARAKLEAEQIVLESGRGVIARVGNVYGPPVKPGTVLGDILAQVPGNGPLRIRDAGAARDFVWVGDIARGLADMATGEATGIFNLGTGVASSAGDIARTALQLCGEEDRPVETSVPTDPGAINTIALDATQTTAVFGWRPEVTLESGLHRLIEERL